MTSKEWVDFTIVDLTFDEEEVYTKQYFEEKYTTIFECLELDDKCRPKFIWTDKYVCYISNFERLLGDYGLIVLPRTPDYDTK